MQLRKRQSALKKELELKENTHLFMDLTDINHLKEKELQITLLETALEDLNEKQKTCIKLFYLENKSYQEITNLLGISNMEVKSFIQNGKRNLKLKLEALINEQKEE